jgi:hypothetical protein
MRITPGIIIKVGSLPMLNAKERNAATGTSKNTIIETTAGETRLRVRLNIVCPRI